MGLTGIIMVTTITGTTIIIDLGGDIIDIALGILGLITMSLIITDGHITCLLYTSPSPRDLSTSRMPSSA